MPPIFELHKNDDQYYYFHFLNGEGDLILISAEYPEKESAEAAINDVRVGSLTANQIAAGRVAGGDAFFVIKDTTGDVLVKSILYNDRMIFDNALHTVKDNACVAEIKDLTAA